MVLGFEGIAGGVVVCQADAAPRDCSGPPSEGFVVEADIWVGPVEVLAQIRLVVPEGE